MKIAELLSRIESCWPADQRPGGLHEPLFLGNEKQYLAECVDSTLVSSVGPFVDRMERRLEEITGAARAVAVVNGTAALHMALLLSGVQAGDEVIVPSLTFVATANAVRHCGAIPHFAEHSDKTLGLDSEALDEHLKRNGQRQQDGALRNRNTGQVMRACVPMHTFGHMVEMDRLVEVCSRHGLVVVEDAAEALGSHYRGRHAGTWAPLGILSFNGNKTVTTGGGGAILAQDKTLGERAKHLTSTAKIPHAYRFEHDAVGYNYRMPNLNAALGVAQLERLPDILARKRNLAERYRQAILEIADVEFVSEPASCRSNYWLNTLRLRPGREGFRDAIVEAALARGIPMRPPWTLLTKLPMYRDCPRMETPVAEALERSLINLPSSPGLGRMETA